MCERDRTPKEKEADRRIGRFIMSFLLMMLGLFWAAWMTLRFDGFWSPVWKNPFDAHVWVYAEWFIWGGFGTIVYLISNVAFWGSRDHKYKEFTFWYLGTSIRGPFVAVVVMLLLSKITLGTTAETGSEIAAAVSLSSLPQPALVAIAFVLGFNHRITVKQMDLLLRWLLPKASAAAEDRFIILPQSAKASPGEKIEFRVEPQFAVTWGADIGAVSESGVWTAPSDFSKATAEAPARLDGVVTARLDGDKSIVAVRGVKVIPFTITGPETWSGDGTPAHAAEPSVDDLEWSLAREEEEPVLLGDDPSSPSKDVGAALLGERVTLRAYSPKLDHTAKKKVTVVKMEVASTEQNAP